MPNIFNETKTTQLAAYLLQKSDGEMFYLKLVKLLYIVDRESIRQLGKPITFDNYVSMDHGPVLSHTLNLMNGMVRDTEGVWNSMITPKNGYKISITDESEISHSALSDAERDIADHVFDEYGHIPRFELADMTHEFEEWSDPHGSNIPIDYSKIVAAVGYDEQQSAAILEEMKQQQAINEFFEENAC